MRSFNEENFLEVVKSEERKNLYVLVKQQFEKPVKSIEFHNELEKIKNLCIKIGVELVCDEETTYPIFIDAELKENLDNLKLSFHTIFSVEETRQEVINGCKDLKGVKLGTCWKCGKEAEYKISKFDSDIPNKEICEGCSDFHKQLGFVVELSDEKQQKQYELGVEFGNALLLKLKECGGKDNLDLQPGKAYGVKPNAVCVLTGEPMVCELDRKKGLPEKFIEGVKEICKDTLIPKLKGMYLGATWRKKFKDTPKMLQFILGGYTKDEIIGAIEYYSQHQDYTSLSTQGKRDTCVIKYFNVDGKYHARLGKSWGKYCGLVFGPYAIQRFLKQRGMSPQQEDIIFSDNNGNIDLTPFNQVYANARLADAQKGVKIVDKELLEKQATLVAQANENLKEKPKKGKMGEMI